MMEYDVKKMYEWPLLAQALVIGLIAGFTFYLGFLMDLSPLRSTIRSQVREEENLKVQLNAYLNNRLVVIETVAQLPALQAKLSQWKKNIIPSSDLQALLDQLLKLGESLHLKFNTFNPQDPVKKEGYTSVIVKINVVGSYDQIATYVSEIANLPTIVSIGNFMLYREEEEKTHVAVPEPTHPVETPKTPEKNLTADLTLEILQR